MATNTLYSILGVEASADADAIEAAYKASQLRLADQPDALSLIRVAYDTLRSPDLRAAYDRKLARAANVAQIELHHSPVESKRRMVWLILMLILSGMLYYYWSWWKRTHPIPSALPPIQLAHQNAGLPPAAAVQSPEPGPVMTEERRAAAAATFVPDASPMPEPDDEPPGPVQRTRGARKTGFDLEYLSWSSFKVRQRTSSGSGVLIAQDKILTNCHVLAGGANGIVVIHSLTGRVAKVEKYARLVGEDACLLYAPGAGGEVIDWGRSEDLKAGDMVYTLGHPGGSAELIWSEAQFIDTVNQGDNTYLRTANYCRPGSSGGPLLDSAGRLVGIVTMVQVMERPGEARRYGACLSVTEASARALLGKSMFPIGFAPAQYYK